MKVEDFATLIQGHLLEFVIESERHTPGLALEDWYEMFIEFMEDRQC